MRGRERRVGRHMNSVVEVHASVAEGTLGKCHPDIRYHIGGLICDFNTELKVIRP